MDRLKSRVPNGKAKKVIIHALILSISIVVTIFIVENKILHNFLEAISGSGLFIASLLSGFFFTSIFTTPIALASFALLGSTHNPLLVSAIGAFGAVFGDAILLKIIQSDIVEDIEVFTKPFTTPKLKKAFKNKIFFFPIALIGAITLASPLPDELAIALFTTVKFKTKYFYILSFVFNFLGILAITSSSAFLAP